MLIITELDIVAKEGYATLIISLLQEINRTKKLMKQSNSTEEYIQYRIYKVSGINWIRYQTIQVFLFFLD